MKQVLNLAQGMHIVNYLFHMDVMMKNELHVLVQNQMKTI